MSVIKKVLVFGLAASLAGCGAITSFKPMQSIKQSAAKAVVAAYGADLSPKAELRASTDPERDEKAKEELGYILGSQAYLAGIGSIRLNEFRYGMGNLAKLAHRSDSDKFFDYGEPGVKFNEWTYLKKLPQPDLKIGITPNVDTLYGGVFFNLAKEPIVLVVPKVNRYFSVQIVDANLSNVAYLGTRASNGKSGKYALVGPQWMGTLPEELELIRIPTNEGKLAVRIRIDGPEEESLLNELQGKFDSIPLSSYLDPAKARAYDDFPAPLEGGELTEYRQIVELAQRNPPATMAQRAAWESYQYIGMSLTEPFNSDNIDPAIRRGMGRAIKSVHDIVAWKVKFRGYKSVSNWNVDLKGGTYGADYLARAEGAVQGYIVHDADEAMYFHTYHDGDKNVLHGDNAYTLHFEPEYLPPVDEFWSITVYGNDYNIIANSIDRYAISNRTKGLKYNVDGSLTIQVQATKPENGTSNWLPTPEGDQFRLNLRMYGPRAVLRSADSVEKYIPPVILAKNN